MCFSTRAARVFESFAPGEIVDVRPLPTGCQLGEGRLQPGIGGEPGLELLGHLEVLRPFHLDLPPGALVRDSLAQIGLHGFLELGHFLHAREPDLPRGLHVPGLLDEDRFRVLEQRALGKQDGAIFLEAVDESDVPAVKHVAGLAPLQLFLEPGREKDLPELLELRSPRLLPLRKCIDLPVHGRPPSSRDARADAEWALGLRGVVGSPCQQAHW